MIKSERITYGLEKIVPLGPSIYNIPHEQRDEILNKINAKINEDMDTNQSREGQSNKLARKFVLSRSNL